MTRRPTVLLLALLAAAPLAAQQDTAATPLAREGSRWLTSWVPVPGGAPNDGPAVGLRWRHWLPAEYGDRVLYRQSLTVTAWTTFRGSRSVGLLWQAPRLGEGWRGRAQAYATRETRYGFFGLGNTTTLDHDLADSTQPYLYRMRRVRYGAEAEVTRRLAGPLALSVGVQALRAYFTALPAPSLFEDAYGARLDEDDLNARAALVLDTRDTEFDTRRGLLLEAGVQGGTGRTGYSRWYGVARGYLPVTSGTVVAVRALASDLRGDATLNARIAVPAWETPVQVLGGEDSHRALDNGRLLGTGVLVGTLEVRQALLDVGEYGSVGLLGFVDAGRVFEGERLRLTTDHYMVGGGLGVAVRVLRGNIFTLAYARGPDGGNISARAGWMF